MLRAIGYGNRFFGLRRDYAALIKNPDKGKGWQTRASNLFDEMEWIVEADIQNARQALPFISRQPAILDIKV